MPLGRDTRAALHSLDVKIAWPSRRSGATPTLRSTRSTSRSP